MNLLTVSSHGRVSGRSVDSKPQPSTDAKRMTMPHLPNISAAGASSRNPLALHAVDSKAHVVKSTAQDRWRSALLEYEVSLKEIVTNDMEAPPSGPRVMRVIQLFDAVTRVAEDQSPELMDLLKMFRIEFCRAIFPRQTLDESMPMWNASGEAADDDAGDASVAYFDQVSALLRENAALRVEVDMGNTRDNLAVLNHRIEQMGEMVGYLENEVARLERENERTAESCRKARVELSEQCQLHQQFLTEFEDNKMRLLQENKDMQLRLCRMRKYLSDRESTVVKDAYKFLKEKKMSVMAHLFDEGDERVSLLVMLSQLESRVNESLDQYDRETLLCEEAEQPEQQRRMLSVVSILLEEMHLCEARYIRLLPEGERQVSSDQLDETDGFVSLLSDPRAYESLIARVKAREEHNMELNPIGSDEGTDSSTHELMTSSSIKEIKRETSILQDMPPISPSTEAPIVVSSSSPIRQSSPREPQRMITSAAGAVRPREPASDLITIVRGKQNEWVANIFGTAVETTELLHRTLKSSENVTKGVETLQEQLLHKYVSQPLLDVSINKFHCGIDLYTGPGPLTQVFLCSVMHIDPATSLHVPQGTNFMQVKYRNPLRHDVIREQTDQNVTNASAAEAIEEWGGRTSFVREETETEDKGLVASSHVFGELKKMTSRKNGVRGASVVSSSTPSSTTFERLNPLSPNRSPEWLLYQSLFGGYRALTPRLIDTAFIDHILLNSCERHFTRMEERYARCLVQAKGRATNSQMTFNMTERFFKDLYVLTDFQEAIVQELEARYCYPEIVAKTLYEMLCYLDATVQSQPLVDLYLSCIRGFESPTRIHYITYVLYQLSINWPSSNPEESVLREDVLTLLEYIYKRASCVSSTEPEEILNEYQMATRSAPITLSSLRSYLVTTMLHFEDPLLLYFNGLLSYKATSSSVVEMNFDKFEAALKEKWEEKVEGKTIIRFLTAGCGFVKKSELKTKELACVAASMWSSQLWTTM